MPTTMQPGKSSRRLAHELRVAHGGRAEDHAVDALVEPGDDRVEIADAAAELHRDVTAARIASTAGAFTGLACERSVQVDHVQPVESGCLEGACLRRRIDVEHGSFGHVALPEPHALPVLQVDGGKQDHGFQFRKLAISAKPELLALLGVELAACHVVLGDDRGDRAAVVGARQHVRLSVGVEVVGVHEIGVKPVRRPAAAARAPDARATMSSVFQPICGIFRFSSRGEIFSTSPAIQSKPSVVDMLLAARRHQLHADADAEERPRLDAHRFGHRLDHAVKRVEAAAAIGEGADAGQHDAIGAIHHLGIARSRRSSADRAMLARGALERLGGRVQIAGAVIDDGNAHRDAPGSGNKPMMLALRQRRRPGKRLARNVPGRRRRAAIDRPLIVARPRCLAVQRSKKRRSAASSSSATTMSS